jgi:hypothetical protein
MKVEQVIQSSSGTHEVASSSGIPKQSSKKIKEKFIGWFRNFLENSE